MTEFDWLQAQIEELAGYVRQKYAQRDSVRVDTKRDANDLLTEVDLAVQRRLIEAIEETFPGDSIVAEEEGYGDYPEDPGLRCWVIDPIDGTQNFVRGLFPAFGISVAFAEGGIPRCGVVDMPIARRHFAAREGAPATCNGHPIGVSGVSRFGESRVEIDFASPELREPCLDRFGEAIVRGGEMRCLGSCSVGLCSVASGHGEVYLHAGPYPWDYAAGILIVERAGGRVTRLDGSPIRLFDRDQSIVATNGRVHDETLRIVAPA